MKIVGIVCEYNPFHNGHARQISAIRRRYGADTAVVCLMSGNYVQRGMPALFSKDLRARAALLCGADLVLELPLTVCLSSAEGYADGGVRILNAVGCDAICFGSESGDSAALMQAAELHLRPEFDSLIRANLSTGCSYPAAREAALRDLGAEDVLTNPNDILAVEYCKAILRQGSSMEIMTVKRGGDYHTEILSPDEPSATALRAAILSGEDWKTAVPKPLQELYVSARRFTMSAGERAVLARLRTLPDSVFEALPFGAEGLWSKLMKNCRSCASVEEILCETKSKRYTRTRLQRMLLCAYLGVSATDLNRDPPYVRVLGFTDRGRVLLRQKREGVPLINAGQKPPETAYCALEQRASDLYGLFSQDDVPPCGRENALRIVYQPSL